MRCEDVQGQLQALAAGELPVGIRRAVEAHLVDCVACRAVLADVDPLARPLAGAGAPPVPAGFAFRVMAAARQSATTRSAAAWNPLAWWRLASAPMHAAAAIVLVAGLAAGLVMGWASAPSAARAAAPAQVDPLDPYSVDYLGEAPAGSLADSYLALVTATEEGGR